MQNEKKSRDENRPGRGWHGDREAHRAAGRKGGMARRRSRFGGQSDQQVSENQ